MLLFNIPSFQRFDVALVFATVKRDATSTKRVPVLFDIDLKDERPI